MKPSDGNNRLQLRHRDQKEAGEQEEADSKVEEMAGEGGQSSGLQDILRGYCDGAQRTKSNMIRVFVSSTFTGQFLLV